MSAHAVTLIPPLSRAADPEPYPRPDARPVLVAVPALAPVEALPDPRPLAENLARCVVEILAGTRGIDQIARWLSAEVHAHLLKRVVLSARARRVRGEQSSRPTFTLGRAVLSEPAPGVVEAVVVVHGRARSRAVAIRLEQFERRWRASAVHVL
jgi:hypothetical protein